MDYSEMAIRARRDRTELLFSCEKLKKIKKEIGPLSQELAFAKALLWKQIESLKAGGGEGQQSSVLAIIKQIESLLATSSKMKLEAVETKVISVSVVDLLKEFMNFVLSDLTDEKTKMEFMKSSRKFAEENQERLGL